MYYHPITLLLQAKENKVEKFEQQCSFREHMTFSA